MFTILHTSMRETDDRMALALCVTNPISGVRYTLSLGVIRNARSNLEDTEAYSRRLADYRRAIDLSANP